MVPVLRLMSSGAERQTGAIEFARKVVVEEVTDETVSLRAQELDPNYAVGYVKRSPEFWAHRCPNAKQVVSRREAERSSSTMSMLTGPGMW